MDMTPQEYQEYVKRLAPKSPIFKDTAFAFFIGGAICALGQLIQNGFLSLGLAKADAGTATSICLIFLSALLTGLNLYNSIARFAGAGTLVPITGFANSVVSPAIDFKSEGFITGMASKMFVVAGPVIVFGTLASFLPTYHLHAFTLNGGCVLFCFQCIFIIPHQLILVDGEIFLF
jgi:stage V sporulation protein AC